MKPANRIAIVCAAIGYVLAAWYYTDAFAGLGWDTGRSFLWHLCISCVSVTGLHSRVTIIGLMIIAPINAALYAFVGLIVGKIFRNRQESSMNTSG